MGPGEWCPPRCMPHPYDDSHWIFWWGGTEQSWPPRTIAPSQLLSSSRSLSSPSYGMNRCDHGRCDVQNPRISCRCQLIWCRMADWLWRCRMGQYATTSADLNLPWQCRSMDSLTSPRASTVSYRYIWSQSRSPFRRLPPWTVSQTGICLCRRPSHRPSCLSPNASAQQVVITMLLCLQVSYVVRASTFPFRPLQNHRCRQGMFLSV